MLDPRGAPWDVPRGGRRRQGRHRGAPGLQCRLPAVRAAPGLRRRGAAGGALPGLPLPSHVVEMVGDVVVQVVEEVVRLVSWWLKLMKLVGSWLTWCLVGSDDHGDFAWAIDGG